VALDCIEDCDTEQVKTKQSRVKKFKSNQGKKKKKNQTKSSQKKVMEEKKRRKNQSILTESRNELIQATHKIIPSTPLPCTTLPFLTLPDSSPYTREIRAIDVSVLSI
jgi:hypothetical protein